MSQIQEEVVLSAPDVSCEHCVRSIDSALSPLPGVEAVQTDLASKTVRLRYDPTQTPMATIEAALDDAGYTVRSSPHTTLTTQYIQVEGGIHRPQRLLREGFASILIAQAGAWLDVSISEVVAVGRSQTVSSPSRPREIRFTKRNIKAKTPPQNAKTARTQRTSPNDMAFPFPLADGAFASRRGPVPAHISILRYFA